jgi:predicted phage tail protein
MIIKFVGFNYPDIEIDSNSLQTIIRGLICNLGEEFKKEIKGVKLTTYTTTKEDEVVQDVGELVINDKSYMPIVGEIMYICKAIDGSGGNFFNVLLGAVLIGAGLLFASPLLLGIGATLFVRGLSSSLAPTTNTPSKVEQQDSYLFSNTLATNRQSDPIPLLIGQYLCQSIPILSSSITKVQGV